LTEYSITHNTGNYDRIFEWKVVAVDYAGNETWSEQKYRVVVDGTKPTVEITNVEIDGDNLSFTVVGQDILSGTSVVSANIYDETNSGTPVISIGRLAEGITPETTSVLSYNPTNLDISDLESGTYTIQAMVRDYANNSQYATHQIVIDNTAPTTTSTGIDSLWHNSNVTVTLTCTDTNGSGCHETYYSLDGGAKYEKGVTVTVSTNGENTITFYSEDKAGNTETAQTSEVIKIDKINPTAELPNITSFTQGLAPNTVLALSDNYGLSQVCYSLNGVAQPCITISGTSYDWDITDILNDMVVGNSVLSYYVVDQAGNQSDSNDVTP